MLLKGIPVSDGIVFGKIFLKNSKELEIIKKNILEKDIPLEIQKFEDSIKKTKKELEILHNKVLSEMGGNYANLFSVYILILEDSVFISDIIKQIEKGINLEFALHTFIENTKISFSNIDDVYLKERERDIIDVVKKIIKNLGTEEFIEEKIPEDVILVANNLSPADTVNVKNKNVKAFLTNLGGKTSHTAIFSQALGIPAVVGLKNITEIVKTGDFVIVNGFDGNIIINPTEKEILEYQNSKEKIDKLNIKLAKIKDLPAITKDGIEVELFANIEIPEEIESVINNAADGIGLYRTEFLYIDKESLPTEDEQFEKYKFVAEKMYPKPVVIRTIDIGGDKFFDKINFEYENNPFLGLRGIRFAIKYNEIFRIQLRALLRASMFDNIKIMYPMISIAEEILEANRILKEIKQDLKKENIPFNDNLEIGAMIEVPSAAVTVDKLSKYADFFSIGTNDLMQYLFAIDRANVNVSHLYNTKHIAILRTLHFIISNARGKKVEICGAMAGDEKLIKILLGMGFRSLSMNSHLIPRIKNVIRDLKMSECEKKAQEFLSLETLNFSVYNIK
jgi:phosphoenolpyruvate-protein phosphotransferase (PTS system enzyme I)